MGWRVRGLLFGIFALGIWVRLKGISNPLLDDQAWRQADTASMALNMLGHLGDFPDVLFPMLNYDGLGPQKVELEFPFLPYLLAVTWTILGWSDIWGRLWSLLFSLITVYGIFLFGKESLSERAGIWASAFYAVLPLTVYYGRVVMPEPVTQAFSIWALYTVLKWRKAPSLKMFFLAGILMAGAILSKLPQLMIFPVALILGFWPIKGKELKIFQYSLIALFLPMLYYTWVHFGAGNESQFVSGILSGQVMEGTNLYVTLLKKHLREGFSLPFLLIASVGFFIIAGEALSGKSFSRNSNQDKRSLFGLGMWFCISLVYLGVVCLRIPLDYYLIPVALPLVLCASYVFEVFEEIPSFVIGVLVVSLLLVNQTLIYAPKYSWDERYLTQASWIRENTEKEAVVILSEAPPMTLYYSHRYGYRLKSQEDQKAYEELLMTPGEYLVALPGSNKEEFWKKVQSKYSQVGPGVYYLPVNLKE